MFFLKEAGNLKNLHTILYVESYSDKKVNWFTKDARFETERRSEDKAADIRQSESTLPVPVNFVSKSNETLTFFGSYSEQVPKKVQDTRF